MKKCKIEVLKTTFHEDLAKEYGCKDLGKCPMHKVGDIFYGDYAKPEGLCDEAWKAMYQYVFALSHESETFYYGDWIDKKESQSVRATMGFVLLFSKLYVPMKNHKSTIHRSNKKVISHRDDPF